MKVLAIDWSGSASPRNQREHIWTATAADGHLTSLANGHTRPEVIDDLKAMADLDPEFVVGLDFAFSLPAWFLQERSLGSAYDLWTDVALEGESWLRDCEPPFWGRTGTKKLVGQVLHRLTEFQSQPVAGIDSQVRVSVARTWLGWNRLATWHALPA